MRNLIFILLFFFSTLASGKEPSDAETGEIVSFSISGRITENLSGESLTGVEIEVIGTDISVYSDFDGEFEINGLKPGVDYAIRISYISYRKKIIRGLNPGDNKILIKLENDSTPSSNGSSLSNPLS